MVDGTEIKPGAFYDDAAVLKLLGFDVRTQKHARDSGELRFTQKGKRILYRGEWLLDWLMPREASK
jgi:hypothetical protein